MPSLWYLIGYTIGAINKGIWVTLKYLSILITLIMSTDIDTGKKWYKWEHERKNDIKVLCLYDNFNLNLKNLL